MDRSLPLRLLAALAWAVAVTSALVLLAQGLAAGFYIENTEEALAEAHRGHRLVLVSCGLLVALAVVAQSSRWPWWVALGLCLPVVLCGGLTVLAPETLLPQLSAVVAFPGAAVGGLGGLVLLSRAPAASPRRGRRHRSPRLS